MLTHTFRYIEPNGVKLRIVDEGTGPMCVLVHGWPESWYSWRYLIEPLVCAGYRVVVPDVRGYGGSDKPDAVEAYDLTSLTDDIAGLIGALNEQEAFLVGHDWGAPIVWTCAIRYPTRVRAVAGLSLPHLGRSPIPTVDLFKRIYQDPSWLSEEDLAYCAKQLQDGGFRAPLNRYRNYERDHKCLPELSTAKVTRPALYIVGDRDPVLSMIPGHDMLTAMDPWYTDLRGKVVIPGAGHWVHQERPREVSEALLTFFNGLSTPNM